MEVGKFWGFLDQWLSNLIIYIAAWVVCKVSFMKDKWSLKIIWKFSQILCQDYEKEPINLFSIIKFIIYFNSRINPYACRL